MTQHDDLAVYHPAVQSSRIGRFNRNDECDPNRVADLTFDITGTKETVDLFESAIRNILDRLEHQLVKDHESIERVVTQLNKENDHAPRQRT